MFDKVIFYNHFGAGDIFESREFVKAWIKLVPANEYYYAHGKNPRILLDFPELKYTPITSIMNPRHQIFKLNSDLYVNTWIGITGKYLLPGIGCTVERLYDMHNDMLRVMGLGQLSGVPVDYIPDINYNAYSIAAGCELMMKTSGGWVFIDNGLVQSMQANNFDFNPIVEIVAQNNKDWNFLVSQEYDTEQTNVYLAGWYTGGVGFDLNEISFMSLFCDVLIGRNSGPHVFTQVKKNVDSGAKKLLSFTYQPTGASFVVNSPVKIRRYWSGATDTKTVVENIERVLND